jgi:hypothetical protein
METTIEAAQERVEKADAAWRLDYKAWRSRKYGWQECWNVMGTWETLMQAFDELQKLIKAENGEAVDNETD